jgi:hypothetical protein
MATKRPRTPPKRRAPGRRAPTRHSPTNTDHDRPIPTNARLFAQNVDKRLWPSLHTGPVRALRASKEQQDANHAHS